MKKVLLLWYMIGDNFGDTLIYKTVSSFLEQKGYVIENHEVGDKGECIIEHANRCDFLLFAGGGIIERYMPDIIRRFRQLRASLRVPYGVIGISIGNFCYDKQKDTLKAFVCNACFFYVRDRETADVFNLYSGRRKVIYSADCVFANKYLDFKCGNKSTGIGINVRELPYIDITGDIDWEKFRRVITAVNADKAIMDSSKAVKQFFDDKQGWEEYERMGKLEKADAIIRQISGCSKLIAMRYHVVLVAALIGIPSVPILYCPKVKRLSEELGIEELAVGIDEIEIIPEKIRLLNERYDSFKEIIKNRAGYMCKRSEEMFLDIEKVLSEL